MPRQSLEQLPRTGHRERQDHPLRLGEGERAFRGLARRAPVTKLIVRQSAHQQRFNACHVADKRNRAIENTRQFTKSPGRIAFREEHHRAGSANFAGASLLGGKRLERFAGLARHPEAGLRGQQPAADLGRERVRSHQLQLEAFSSGELFERLVAATPASVQHPGREVQQQPDARSGVGLQDPGCAPQPSLGVLELARPDHRAGKRYQGRRDHLVRAPAMPLGERYRLLATLPDRGKRAEFRGETQLREAADFEIGPSDLPGKIGALLQVAFTVRIPQ